MTTGSQVLQLRRSGHDVFLVPLDVVNRHRADSCALHDAAAGLCAYETALLTELAYGREHPEALRDWVRDEMKWTDLEPHARLVRESWRG